jgi:biofilm PGA synthesis N-glycosyltransferase PgaC
MTLQYPNTIFEVVLLVSCGLFVLIQLIVHFYLILPFLKVKKNDLPTHVSWPPISIVISIRADFENIQKLLPELLNQNYPNFEIVLIDDASWDETKSFIEESVKQFPNVKGVYVTEEMKKQTLGKKLALTLGIKAATHEIIVLTDADCMPATPYWLQRMVAPYLENSSTEIVLGYSPFIRKQTFVNLISQMDNLWTAILYFSYAVRNKAYMGVGRNMSYKKSLFLKVKGFASHLHVLSGDDDLFVRDASNSSNTAICIHPDSFMFTSSKSSFNTWYLQKKRHTFVGKYYKFKDKLKLGFIGLSHALMWVLIVFNLFLLSNWFWTLILLLLFWMIKFPLVFMAFKKLKHKYKTVWMPLFDLLYVIYNAMFGLVNLFNKQKKW